MTHPTAKVHASGLHAGERFRLADDPAAPAYEVLDGPDGHTVFRGVSDGEPLSRARLFAANLGSLFVYVIPPEGGGTLRCPAP